MNKKVLLLEGGTCTVDGNKGDELMLVAARQGLAKQEDDYIFVGTIESGSYEERAKWRMHQLLWEQRYSRLSGWLGYPILRRYGRPYGIYADEDLDVVVNFMGYRYADIGAKEIHVDRRRTIKRQRNGTKIIFLPQAYGPFTGNQLRREAAEMFSQAELIYARDELSARYLGELSIRNVLVAPDITIPLKGDLSAVSAYGDYILISPNIWMIERTDAKVARRYLDFLQLVVEWGCGNGLNVILLSHARFQDQTIISRLNGLSNKTERVTVVHEPIAVRVKGLIGGAQLVVGSRYHVLVAALSQNVPAIGTSWAHKYEGLFKDYKMQEYLVDPLIERELLCKKLSELLRSDTREKLVECLRLRNERLVEEVDEMWQKVNECISICS